MVEPSLSKMTDTVVAKSKLLSFSQICNELGVPNDMDSLVSAMSDFEPYLTSVQEEQAYTPEFRNLWLSLRTKLYDTEDMFDNSDTLRDIVIKETQPKVGESELNGNFLPWLDGPASYDGSVRNRVDLEQRMRTMARPREHSESGGKPGSFVLNLKVIFWGLLLSVFVAFMLDFCADAVG